MLWFIIWTSYYHYPWLVKQKVKTQFGIAEVLVGTINNKDVAIICRHWENGLILPHQINHRANILALKELWVDAIVSFSIVWVMNQKYELWKIILAHELYYPDNRLPCGNICTFFNAKDEKNGGHLIMENFYNSGLNSDIINIIWNDNLIDDATYIHFVWPRLSSKAEIRSYRNFGWDIISQTCWPEAVLSWELGIPYTTACFWISYSNGIMDKNTTQKESDSYLEKSAIVFESIIIGLIDTSSKYNFEWFIKRMNQS